ITGSNGKTITKEWAFQVLAGKYSIVRSPRSYNSQIGVPLSIWLLDENFDIGIIEAGISKPGEMEKLEKIIKPDIGIITNIGEAHQQNFSSLTQKVDEKLLLFKNARVIIYCSDYKLIDDRIKSNCLGNEKKTFTWSHNKNADLRITDITPGKTKTDIIAEFKGESKEISIPFVDKASIENAIHVWCLSIYLDQAEASIKKAMISIDPVAMRLEQKKGINNCTLINDAYNSDMGSLSIALDFLNLQNQNRKKTLILSDIFQSGRVEEELYREVSSLIKAKGIDRLIGIGEAISKYKGLFSGEKQFFRSTSEFIDEFKPGNFNDEAILLKGARDFRFEDISGLLEKQSHQTVLEIDLDAMVHNLNYFRSKLKPNTRVMVMVKAFSYGSG
ncbi:MAG: alanine racemase, partial [Bacteroidales bacterium]|nr:alanine racemase [Bacteroidales bacterium]